MVETTKGGNRSTNDYDLLLNGWGQDYPDPYDFINILLDGSGIKPDNNVNLSYFNQPSWNKKIQAAAKLAGAARYKAYAKLDHDLMAGPAPLAPYINTNAQHLHVQACGLLRVLADVRFHPQRRLRQLAVERRTSSGRSAFGRSVPQLVFSGDRVPAPYEPMRDL